MVCFQLATLLLLVAPTHACSEEPWSTFHYWREPGLGLNRYMRTSGNSLSYELHNGNDNEFWYVTTFHQCGNQAYISTRAQSSSKYVGNQGSDNFVDLLPGDSIDSHDHPLLFLYGGDDFMDSVTMRSRVNRRAKYVYGKNRNSVKLRNQRFWWWTIPYVTSGLSGALKSVSGGGSSAIISSLTIRNQVVQVAVNVDTSTTPDQLTVQTVSSTANAFQFDMIKYRIYTEPRYGGQVAVVLRSNDRDYLAVDITADGIIRTPLTHRPSGLRYNIVRLVSYDDIARSRNSTFLKADISLQTVIDDRFFEVVGSSRNRTKKLRSMLNKDRYLAVAQLNSQQPELVITSLRSLPASLINYDFELSNTDAPTTVRRPPNFKLNRLMSRTPEIPTARNQ